MSQVKSLISIKNGWVKEDNQWYYYEDNKKLNTQRIQSKERYYYLEKDGHMVKGWFQTSKSNDWYYLEGTKEDTLGLGTMYCDGIFKIKDKVNMAILLLKRNFIILNYFYP